MYSIKFNTIFTLVVATTLLYGCDSNSDSNHLDTLHHSVNGVASSGGGLKGYVSLNQGQENRTFTPARASLFTTNENGTFTIGCANDLEYPVMLQIEGTHGIEAVSEYSLLLDNKTDRINLSPLTRIIIGRVAGIDAAQVYDNFSDHRSKFTEAGLQKAQSELTKVIQPLLQATNLENNSNLFSLHFSANLTELDSVLANLDFDYHSEKVVITYAPNKAYHVELAYANSWEGAQLIPDDADLESIAQELTVLNTARQLLEQMALLKGDKAQFDALLAENAHWFGSDRQELYNTYFAVLPAETDPSFQRYHDLVLLDSRPQQKQYLVGYTSTFEASTAASVSRDQAWFEMVNGELMFVGDDHPYPTSFYALYKLNTAPQGYNWVEGEAFQWVFEATGFLSPQHCAKVPTSGEWQWNSPSFFESLTPISDVILDLNNISVTSPTQSAIVLDKVYKDPTTLQCHLVDSANRISGLLDGYPINLSSDKVAANQVYDVTYHYTDKTLVKRIYLTEPPRSKQTMAPFQTNVQHIDGTKGLLTYEWSRTSPFVTEGDLYVYHPEDLGQGSRVHIEKGQTSVVKETDADVVRLFHNALDPYGRVINQYYVSADGTTPLTMQ